MADAQDSNGFARTARELRDAAWPLTGSVPWWCGTGGDAEPGWSGNLGPLLGLPGAAEAEVRAEFAHLLRPLLDAADAEPDRREFDVHRARESRETGPVVLRLRARRCDDEAGGLVGVITDVTTEAEGRQALADLAERYRSLIEQHPEPVCVHQDELVVYVNTAALRLVGAESSAAVVGRPLADFLTRETRVGLRRQLAVLSGPAGTPPAAGYLVRLDGSQVLVEAVSVRTTWNGRPAVQAVLRDISAQRAAEAALHDQAALMHHVHNAIISTTGDAVITSWNPAAEAIYGLPSHRALGRPAGEVFGAAVDPAELVDSGGVTEIEHRHADGTPLTIRISAARLADGFILVCADETARRRAEEHYATVVDSLGEGVVVVDTDGRIESANPAAAQILGTTREHLLGLRAATWALYHRNGKALEDGAHPSSMTGRTGQPQRLRSVRTVRGDGRGVWLSISTHSLTPGDPPPHPVVLSFTDITESRAIRKRLERQAVRDPLTGLANRSTVLRRLSTDLRTARTPVAVLFIDLDRFKVINDSLGHQFGDRVLRMIARRLSGMVRPDELAGRLGGDEFVVLSGGEVGDLRRLADRVRSALDAPLTAHGRQIHVEASVGIAVADTDDRRNAEEVLRDADVAMYQAKSRGRGQLAVFDVGLRERMQRHLELEQDLRRAGRLDQLWLAYQPIVSLPERRPVAVEGLLRWTHPVHGTVSPGEFIPLAEESGLIHDIGARMLGTATRELAGYRGGGGLPLTLKANLSARQLDDPSLVESVLAALEAAGLPPEVLCLEITESALMEDVRNAKQTLESVRRAGVALAIDDFGTGHSSLAQLLRLPVDTLKIDRSFTARIGPAAEARAIVQSIIAMAHAVGLSVIAEGVEDAEQLAVLVDLGCDEVQGFHFGRPTPITELPEVLAGITPEVEVPAQQPSTADTPAHRLR
ncbi:sensor domain-containing protein [Saccharopolyspora cebuensis]|uniref:EAL domain-containing protein n=1 Tax=Saccharopolyspora cebuensis TaxID=418759 RepID=A0ABV4CLC2_9PSEU